MLKLLVVNKLKVDLIQLASVFDTLFSYILR